MSPGHSRDTRTCAPDVHQTEACEIRDLLDRLGGKWSLLVIELLGGGTRRFTELRRTIDGISQRMLSLTLRQLERDGLVRRTVHPTVPPRVDYALTPMGGTLLELVEPLVAWTRANRDEIAAARAAHDSGSPRPAPDVGPGRARSCTLMAPAARSPATRNASAASSRSKRWVISASGSSGVTASTSAPVTNSRVPWWWPYMVDGTKRASSCIERPICTGLQ